jgi:hypothetical protein
MLACLVFAQDPATVSLEYSSDAMVPATQAELYSRALSWMESRLRSGRSSIDYVDSSRGRIVTSGRMGFSPVEPNSSRATGWIEYRLVIEVREGGYSLAFSEPRHVAEPMANDFGGLSRASSLSAVSFGALLHDVDAPGCFRAGRLRCPTVWGRQVYADAKQVFLGRARGYASALDTALRSTSP